jgi:putative oxidoreductase
LIKYYEDKIINNLFYMFKKIYAVVDDVTSTEKELAYAFLFTRIAVAVFFITHGYDKFFGEMGLAGFTGMLTELGFPMAGILAFLVAFAELFGGIAILLGIMTRFWAFWLAVISFVAWWVVKGFALGMDKGDLDVLALGLTLALVFAGPGALSLSAYFKCKDGNCNN